MGQFLVDQFWILANAVACPESAIGTSVNSLSDFYSSNMTAVVHTVAADRAPVELARVLPSMDFALSSCALLIDRSPIVHFGR
jgi:hypothetical protein